MRSRSSEGYEYTIVVAAVAVIHEHGQEGGKAGQCHYLEDHSCKNCFENEIILEDFPFDDTHVPPVMPDFPDSFTISKEFGA